MEDYSSNKDENEDDKVESKDPDYEPGLEFD